MTHSRTAVLIAALSLGAVCAVNAADTAAPAGKPEGADRTATVVIDDAMITAKVKSSLLADTSTQGLKIDVDTRAGVVQLKGAVASESEKLAAQKLPQPPRALKSVENHLTIGH